MGIKTRSRKRDVVLEFIRIYMRMHGVSPSYAVIASGLGLRSKSNIHRIVHRLKDDGHLTVKSHRINGVKVVDRSAKEIAKL
jgi:SOS-response transcriptional repressor LexA